MSVPFSNTHLKIPRGFGAVLSGLVREVLRDQPEDIPKYAAQYFSSLLQQRNGNWNFVQMREMSFTDVFNLIILKTESGIDPAEWAAGLEDRFYSNAFKDTEVKQITVYSTVVKINIE